MNLLKPYVPEAEVNEEDKTENEVYFDSNYWKMPISNRDDILSELDL